MNEAVDEVGRESEWRNLSGFDLFGSSVVAYQELASRAMKSGVFGEPSKATAEKGKIWLEAAASGLAHFVRQFKAREIPPRVDHH